MKEQKGSLSPTCHIITDSIEAIYINILSCSSLSLCDLSPEIINEIYNHTTTYFQALFFGLRVAISDKWGRNVFAGSTSIILHLVWATVSFVWENTAWTFHLISPPLVR